MPVTVREAKVWVNRHHRRHRAPAGAKYAIAVVQDDEVVGVAIVGRPVSHALDDGWTIEVTRVAVLPDHPNACSMLYGAAWRAARAMGYRKAITYTLDTEPGTSLKAAGWRVVAEVKAGSWSRKSRPRVDTLPEQAKFRWETG